MINGPDPSSHGGHPYTDEEIKLGYGTDHDPRFQGDAEVAYPYPSDEFAHGLGEIDASGE